MANHTNHPKRKAPLHQLRPGQSVVVPYGLIEYYDSAIKRFHAWVKRMRLTKGEHGYKQFELLELPNGERIVKRLV